MVRKIAREGKDVIKWHPHKSMTLSNVSDEHVGNKKSYKTITWATSQ